LIPIGELSRRTGVHIETIRFYERSGVLPEAQRSESGRRLYGEADVRRLTFIRHARQLGFELDAIRTMLALQEQPDAPCGTVDALARQQLVAVDARITQLTALRGELTRMIDTCAGGSVGACRIIEALAEPTALAPAAAEPCSPSCAVAS
jgi:DNA-binding transcriptional MerR regulator